MIYLKPSTLVATLSFLVIYCKGAALNATNTTDKSVEAVTSIMDLELPEDRVDIIYSSSQFKEIDPDILQVTDDKGCVKLSCLHTKDNSSFVDWHYHGTGKRQVNLRHDDNEAFLNLSAGPPVARMECVSAKDPSITNNTLLYTGDGKPPYLHNHGKSVKAQVLNATTANFPCLLNYPLDNSDEPMELKLFKDGEMVENKNNCLSYTPELGYFLNLTKLDNPLGKYECRVVNSTEEDVVSVELNNDNFVRVVFKGHRNSFYEGAPQTWPFECSLPKSMFENNFQWFYLYKNGEYVPIEKSERVAGTSDSSYYSETVKVKFGSVNISDVVCAGFVKSSTTSYNNSVPVLVIEPYQPNILNDPHTKPIIYTKGKNLTCASSADPVDWQWQKNGKKIEGRLNISEVYTTTVKRSTISLDPTADDLVSNYTCVASNFLGNASHSFIVKLSEKEPLILEKEWLVTIAISLGLLVVIIGFLLIFFKVNVKLRRLDKQHIINFFKGLGSKGSQYNELEDEVEPYASISYDYSREIKYKSLIFERELKGGQFGKVIAGRLIDKNNGTTIPVAIKSMKDNPQRSQSEIEDAFLSFLNEIKIMQYVGYHSNVVGYVGAVTSDIAKYSAYLVVEYCSGGDLKTYLERNKASFHDDILGLHHTSQFHGPVLKTSHLMKWAEDITAGLEYIAAKNIIHMDIAARNVLLAYQGINSDEYCNLDPSKLNAKISDFGISKTLNESTSDYYQILFHPEPEKNKPRVLPLRWLSREALETLKFNTESDIWALAVTFWEMFTLGDVPYNNVDFSGSNQLRFQLISHLKEGNRLPEPDYAPQEMWDIMSQCWDETPLNRPSLKSIRDSLHILNEKIQRDLQCQPEQELIYVQPTFAPYSTVGLVENLAYSPTDEFECSMEYSDEDGDIIDADGDGSAVKSQNTQV